MEGGGCMGYVFYSLIIMYYLYYVYIFIVINENLF